MIPAPAELPRRKLEGTAQSAWNDSEVSMNQTRPHCFDILRARVRDLAGLASWQSTMLLLRDFQFWVFMTATNHTFQLYAYSAELADCWPGRKLIPPFSQRHSISRPAGCIVRSGPQPAGQGIVNPKPFPPRADRIANHRDANRGNADSGARSPRWTGGQAKMSLPASPKIYCCRCKAALA